MGIILGDSHAAFWWAKSYKRSTHFNLHYQLCTKEILFVSYSFRLTLGFKTEYCFSSFCLCFMCCFECSKKGLSEQLAFPFLQQRCCYQHSLPHSLFLHSHIFHFFVVVSVFPLGIKLLLFELEHFIHVLFLFA